MLYNLCIMLYNLCIVYKVFVLYILSLGAVKFYNYNNNKVSNRSLFLNIVMAHGIAIYKLYANK